MIGKKVVKKSYKMIGEDKNNLDKQFNFAYADKKTEEITIEYIKRLSSGGKSPLTVKEYARTISHFLKFLQAYEAEPVSKNILKKADIKTFLSFFKYYGGKDEYDKENANERMLERLYYFNDVNPEVFLSGHKKFLNNPKTIKKINDLKDFLKGEIISGKEIYKHFGNIGNDLEKFEENNIIKRDYFKTKSPKSLARAQSVLRGYFKFLSITFEWGNHDYLQISSTKYSKEIAGKVFIEEDLINFLRYFDPDFNDTDNEELRKWEHKRDVSIVYLLYSSGMRISEILQLSYRDIPFQKNQIKIIGKGQRERYVVILDIVERKIKDYIESLKSSKKIEIDDDDPLFIKIPYNEIKPLTTRDIQRSIQKLKQIYPYSLPPYMTTHSLRHSFATHLLKNGLEIKKVQKLLGHSDINTTQVYLNLNDDYIRDKYEEIKDTFK